MNRELEYISRYYGVPAKKGQRIEFEGVVGGVKRGVITGASGPHLKVRLDGDKSSGIYHPTWKMKYLKDGE